MASRTRTKARQGWLARVGTYLPGQAGSGGNLEAATRPSAGVSAQNCVNGPCGPPDNAPKTGQSASDDQTFVSPFSWGGPRFQWQSNPNSGPIPCSPCHARQAGPCLRARARALRFSLSLTLFCCLVLMLMLDPVNVGTYRPQRPVILACACG